MLSLLNHLNFIDTPIILDLLLHLSATMLDGRVVTTADLAKLGKRKTGVCRAKYMAMCRGRVKVRVRLFPVISGLRIL